MAELEREYPAPRRVVVGTAPDRAAELVLSDADGRPRLVLKVEADGNPRIDLLDTDGNVTRSLTG